MTRSRLAALPSALLLPFLAMGARAQTSAPVLYATDFSTLDGWTVQLDCAPGFSWAADATPSAPHPHYLSIFPDTTFLPYVSPPASLNFNDGIWLGGGTTPVIACGSVVSPPIDLSLAQRTPVLRFMAGVWAEGGCLWDVLLIRVQSVGGNTVHRILCPNQARRWEQFESELDASWGLVEIHIEFDTVDLETNSGPGPFIDDLEVIDRCSVGPNSPCDDYLPFCFGDGTGAACPCANGSDSRSGQGCRNSSGEGATLVPSGEPSVLNDTMRFQLDGAPAQSFAFLVSANNALPMTDPGQGIPDYDGLRCVGGNLLRHGARATDLAGRAGFGTPGWGGMDNPPGGIIGQYGFIPGQSRYFQIFVRDNVNAVCGTGGNRSNGVKVTFQ